jgi:hypothetical protein
MVQFFVGRILQCLLAGFHGEDRADDETNDSADRAGDEQGGEAVARARRPGARRRQRCRGRTDEGPDSDDGRHDVRGKPRSGSRPDRAGVTPDARSRSRGAIFDVPSDVVGGSSGRWRQRA